MSNMTSEKNSVSQKTPEEVLKSTAQKYRVLEKQYFQTSLANNNITITTQIPDNSDQILVDRAKLISNLSQLVQDSVKIGNDFPVDELENLQNLSNLALKAIESKNRRDLYFLLDSPESDRSGLNYLEKMIHRLYPEKYEELDEKQFPFVGELKMGMSNDEFIALLDKYLTPEDVEILGGKDVAAKKLSECYPFLGVFAAFPATFDIDAFMATAGFGMKKAEAKRAFDIGLRNGILQSGSEDKSRRVSISESMQEKMKQFLTD